MKASEYILNLLQNLKNSVARRLSLSKSGTARSSERSAHASTSSATAADFRLFKAKALTPYLTPPTADGKFSIGHNRIYNPNNPKQYPTAATNDDSYALAA